MGIWKGRKLFPLGRKDKNYNNVTSLKCAGRLPRRRGNESWF